MIYLKKFLNHQDYESYITGDTAILPNVSLCETENDIHYNPTTSPSETRLIVKYNVVDANEPTQLYQYYADEGEEEYWEKGVDMFTNVEIDGTEVSVETLDTAEGKYQLSVGEHIVKYTLKDPTYIGSEWDETGDILIKVGADFYWCQSVASVEIPNSVITIYTFTFGCESLTSITIPDSVTSIGSGAFNRCSSLSSITIPDSVTSIGFQAFDDCYNLSSITIPSGITSIGDEAFGNCGSLSSITSYATTAPTVDYGTFFNVATGGTLYYPDGSDYSQWLSNNQYYLGYYGWNKKAKLSFRDGTIVIINGQGDLTNGDIAQYSATTIIAEVYTDIAQNAFSGFTNLTDCSISDGVLSIGDSAFRNCSSLEIVNLYPLTPPTLGVNVFDGNAQERIIYVPEGTLNTYVSAPNWSTYANDIIENGK